MANLIDSPLALMMILLIMGFVFMIGIAFFSLIIVWVKGYCFRIFEMPDIGNR